MTNGYLRNNPLSNYYGNPTAEENIQLLYEFFIDNDIDFLAILGDELISPQDPLEQTFFPEESSTGLIPLTAAKIWEIAGPIKTNLKLQYPNQAAKIDNWFPCRVLGVALESMVLSSLGVPKNTSPISSPSGTTAIPDAMLSSAVWDYTWYDQPIVLEVKGRFSTTNLVFDYSQSQQYSVYRSYITSNTHKPNGTLSHGIYVIMPSGFSLSENTISLASDQNIPLYLSGIELHENNQLEAQITPPVVQNLQSLNRTDLLINFLPDAFYEWAMPRRMIEQNNLKLDPVDLGLQVAADNFANSYLETNDTPNEEDCPD